MYTKKKRHADQNMEIEMAMRCLLYDSKILSHRILEMENEIKKLRRKAMLEPSPEWEDVMEFEGFPMTPEYIFLKDEKICFIVFQESSNKILIYKFDMKSREEGKFEISESRGGRLNLKNIIKTDHGGGTGNGFIFLIDSKTVGFCSVCHGHKISLHIINLETVLVTEKDTDYFMLSQYPSPVNWHYDSQSRLVYAFPFNDRYYSCDSAKELPFWDLSVMEIKNKDFGTAHTHIIFDKVIMVINTGLDLVATRKPSSKEFEYQRLSGAPSKLAAQLTPVNSQDNSKFRFFVTSSQKMQYIYCLDLEALKWTFIDVTGRGPYRFEKVIKYISKGSDLYCMVSNSRCNNDTEGCMISIIKLDFKRYKAFKDSEEEGIGAGLSEVIKDLSSVALGCVSKLPSSHINTLISVSTRASDKSQLGLLSTWIRENVKDEEQLREIHKITSTNRMQVIIDLNYWIEGMLKINID